VIFGSSSKCHIRESEIYIDYKLNKSVRPCIVCTRVAAAAEALVRSQGRPWGYGGLIGTGTDFVLPRLSNPGTNQHNSVKHFSVAGTRIA
jgi:hypothetical protein